MSTYPNGSPKNLREALAYGCGAPTDAPRMDHLEACVKDFLRNKICVLTMSPTPEIQHAGEYLARELGLYENVKKPEASLP